MTEKPSYGPQRNGWNKCIHKFLIMNNRYEDDGFTNLTAEESSKRLRKLLQKNGMLLTDLAFRYGLILYEPLPHERGDVLWYKLYDYTENKIVLNDYLLQVRTLFKE